MKDKIWKAAKVKLRKILETELNSKNVIQAVNECVLPIISYSFGIINWNEGDLKAIDINIRKLLNLYKMFELKSDVDRLYTPRGAGGRGMLSVWDSFVSTTSRIAHVLENTEQELLRVCYAVDIKSSYSNVKRAEKFEAGIQIKLPQNFEQKPILQQARVRAGCVRISMAENRLRTWKEKPQHGAFLRQLSCDEIDINASLSWLNRCHLDPHSESYVCAAQEMALFTRYHEKHILRSRDDDKCRICSKEAESIFHILSGCDRLAKREYFTRHNAVCKYVHLSILKSYSLARDENWFTHNPRDVILSKNVEIIYDQIISTDRPIGANRPDIIVKDIVQKKAYIIDISCPCDTNVGKKEAEKISKYGELRVELSKMWGMECEVIPVVIGGLGAVTKSCNDHLAKIPGKPKLFMCQKITLLGSKRILSDVLRRK